jgi:hypothetical protein
MATDPLTTGNEADAAPVACTLSSAEMPAQVSQWEQLITRTMTGRTETTDGVRLRFRADPGVQDELHLLIKVEKQCCPWASWTIGGDTREIVLEVRSTEAGLAALHTMFTRPAPTAGSCSGRHRSRVAYPAERAPAA